MRIQAITKQTIVHRDGRGFFSELFKNKHYGQFSVNCIETGMIKGNHWHMSKVEKFIVVQGRGVIRLKNVITNEIIELEVDSNKITIIDILPGYSHSVENTGNIDMIMIIWANEVYNPDKPDTYRLDVIT